MKTFAESLSSQHEGNWELLRTAIGIPESVELTASRLSRSELDKGAHGASQGQSQIRRRVEALAVSHRELLGRLAGEWKRPSEFPKEGDGFFIPAWRQSLRHLHRLGLVQRSDVDVPSLSDEVDLVFSECDEVLSWDELLDQYGRLSPIGRARSVRNWGKCKLLDSTVGFGEKPFHPLMLRVLRGREGRLDSTGAQCLVDYCRQQLLSRDTFEAAIAVETCRNLAADIVLDVQREVAAYLETSSADPLRAIPLVYVLLGTGWTTP